MTRKDTDIAKLMVQRANLVEKTADIPIDDIHFPTDNPRIAQHGQGLSQEEIQEILFDQEDGRTLKKQILVDGQQYEEPYVIKSGDKFIVQEGSRRTSAMKSILEDIRAGRLTGVLERDFAKMRCKILKSSSTEAEIRKFLASIHISGKKDWPAANKGEVIFLMIDKDGETYQSVADHLGMSKSTIEKLFKAYQMTREFCQRYGGQYMHTFSYWDEYFKKKSLQTQAQNDPNFRDYVMELVHDDKIHEHKQMRKLAEFYDEDLPKELRVKAIKALEKDGMKIAYEIFVNYSDRGSLALIQKAQDLIEDIQVSALRKTTFQKDIPDAIDDLIKSAKDVKKTLAGLTAAGAMAI